MKTLEFKKTGFLKNLVNSKITRVGKSSQSDRNGTKKMKAYQVCSACDGSGLYDWGTQKRCNKCNGLGKVVVLVKVMEDDYFNKLQLRRELAK